MICSPHSDAGDWQQKPALLLLGSRKIANVYFGGYGLFSTIDDYRPEGSLEICALAATDPLWPVL